ncbi:N-acetylmuramoyl-L-alanine amidase [Streptomyces sp. SCSIO ZS0520]|uniref:N-acetylmuramoyl-L-alanine amidase n=1 Tax=Streptomyces sp. SCSIO ZS0520 TaxID=2892996 RepID=UPI0039864D4E
MNRDRRTTRSALGTTRRSATRLRRTLLGGLLGACLALPALPATATGAPAPEPTGEGRTAAAFREAARASQVPRDLLVALGYSETHLDGHDGKPSQARGYGVMHLTDNPDQHTLRTAAELTGLDPAALRRDTRANIRGAAAVLREYADDLGLDAAERRDPAAWYPAIARYSGAGNDSTARLYADAVYTFLAQGVRARTPEGEQLGVPRQRITPDRGRYEDVTSLDARPATGGKQTADASVLSEDYPPARWIPAAAGNYARGRSAAIRTIVIHVTQGSYAGSISWFQNPASGVSAHYILRSSDGEVTQMVRDGDTAYHARSANPSALGIEHEGYVSDPSWFTDAMYRSSAALTRHLADRHGIPKDRAHIVGHNEVPGNDHTDPGPHWNWNYYMSLVQSGGGLKLGGSPTDFSGDGKADVVTFTHGAAADVYAATSTGSGFSGTTVKWNDYFALSGEVPSSGDFDGDGKDDIVTFTRGSLADVYVGLSSGSAFSGGVKWNDFFAVGGEVPATGDFNGDGKDDIVTFTNDANGDAFVALSDGAKFGAGVKWHDFLAPNGEFPAIGDVNGDGKDDVVVFTQGTRGDVFVALSTGSGFAPAQLAHEFFAPGAEQPRVGDVNGDGKDDIVTFTSNADRDVYVALSDGAKFGPGVKWNDSFTPAGEFPYVGDFDGDGKDDIVTFTKNASADVYVGLSTGSSFGAGAKWHDLFGLPGETAF